MKTLAVGPKSTQKSTQKRYEKDAIRPGHIHFVLLTVNEAELEEAKAVFGFDEERHQMKEEGLEYFCRQMKIRKRGRINVALVSFADRHGPNEAMARARSIQQILKPDYILIIGIAGGLRKNDKSVCLGDVIVSYLIQTGGFGHFSDRIRPILQPDFALYDRAAALAGERKWLRGITKSRPEQGEPKVILSQEIASAGTVVSEKKTPGIVKLLHEKYPRVSAVEMEAGGVADQLLRTPSSEPPPGYLVVKGISDIADEVHDNVEEKPSETPAGVKDMNKAQRERWERYASHVSAVFAYELIKTFVPEVERPMSIYRLRPFSVRDSCRVNYGCSGVLFKVSPEVYSEIADYNVRRARYYKEYKEHLFFSVCAYDPISLWNLILERYKANQPGTDFTLDLSNFTAWALQKFSHFRTFREMALDEAIRPLCKRLILLDNINEMAKSLDRNKWNFFKELNGKVPCWAVERKFLGDESFITDHVVIADKLILDYYDDAQTLIATDATDLRLRRYFLALVTDFQHKEGDESENNPFKRLEWLDAILEREFVNRANQAPPKRSDSLEEKGWAPLE